MSVFQSFQTGLAIGKEQRKERDRTAARASASEMFKLGNYEGAESALIGVEDYDAANAYYNAGKRKTDAEQQKAYGEAFKTGGAKALTTEAGNRGDWQTYSIGQGIDDSNVLRERQLVEWRERQRQSGVVFLADKARDLKAFSEEERGAKALEYIAQSDFADNQDIISAVQAAAADGRITDDELEGFRARMLTYAQELEAERWQADFDQRGKLGQGQLDLGWAELGARREEAAAKAAGDKPTNPAGLTDAQIKMEVEEN